MYRQLLRSSNLKKTINFNWFLRSSSNLTNKIVDLNNDEIRKRIDLREQFLKAQELNDQEKQRSASNELLNAKTKQSNTEIQRLNLNTIKQERTTEIADDRELINDTKLNEDREVIEQHKDKRIETISKTTNLQSSEKFFDLIHTVNTRENLDDLFEAIESHVAELEALQVGIVFDRLNSILYDLRIDNFYNYCDKLNELERSPVFNSLINHANYSILHLSISSLINILLTITLMNKDSHSQIVKNVIQMLTNKFDDFTFKESIRCLQIISRYLNVNKKPTNQIFKFSKDLILNTKNQVIDYTFMENEIRFIGKSLRLFLKPSSDSNVDIANSLIEKLVKPELKISEKQAIQLLKSIAFVYIEFRKTRSIEMNKEMEDKYFRRQLFPKTLNSLVSKCNQSIYDSFYLDANDGSFYYYLVNMHDSVNTLNFEFSEFYDARFLNFLTPYLLRVHEEKRDRLKFYIANLVQNYNHQDIYDERLLQLIYNFFIEDEAFRKCQDINFYLMFSKLRLSFVDHQKFSELLFKEERALNSFRDKTLCLRLICEFILNDVNHADFYNYLIDMVNTMYSNQFRRSSIRLLKHIQLANAYLQKFSNLDNKLKSNLKETLDQILHYIEASGKMPSPNFVLFQIDDRLIKHASLSNGILIDVFAIYNKSMHKLESLASFTNQFHKVDLIELNQDQRS